MPSTRFLTRLLAIIASGGAVYCILMVPACSPSPPPAAGTTPSTKAPAEHEATRTPAKRVLLLTVDTLRADALPIYGNNRVKTPALTRLADESTVFENAIATSPWTRPTITSILTGLPPSLHGAMDRDIDVEAILPESVTTLPEYLKRVGYKTAAFAYNPFIAASPNLKRGFDVFEAFPRSPPDAAGKPRASDPQMFIDRTTQTLTDMTLAWLDTNAGGDFFLWLHYYDPHLPYAPEKRHLQSLSTVPIPRDENTFREEVIQLNTVYEECLRLERELLRGSSDPAVHRKHAAFAREVEQILPLMGDLYLAEVMQVDEGIGRVVAKLKEQGIFDETLIVVTSDHGEEFAEHGRLEHGHALHRELISIPLLVKLPHQKTPHRIRERVTVLGIMPTILDACAVATLNEQVYAPSLAKPCRTGKEPAPLDYVLAEHTLYGPAQVAVITGSRKYIQDRVTSKEAVYDIAIDPLEKRNLVDLAEARETIERAREILKEHETWSAAYRERIWKGRMQLTRSDAAQRKLLRRHGYVK